MTPKRALFTLLLTTALATSQSAARIEGRVITDSGDPLRKASVSLQSIDRAPDGQMPSAYIEISDGNGGFVFENIPPGRYAIAAERIGFGRSIPETGIVIVLSAGDAKRDVLLKVPPQAVISGRVTDQDGDPIAFPQVSVAALQYASGQRRLNFTNWVRGDDLGNFRIAGIKPGRYYIVADDMNPQGWYDPNFALRLGRTAREFNVPTYYPNAPGPESAVPVDLKPGADVPGIDIRMRKAGHFSIRGKAVDAVTGKPVDSTVTLVTKSSIVSPVTQTKAVETRADGGFGFQQLVPGTYSLRGPHGTFKSDPAPGSSATNLDGNLEITVRDSDVEGIVFTLSHPADVTGTLAWDESERDSAGPTPFKGLTPHPIVTFDDTSLPDGDQRGAGIQEDGTFRITSLHLSKYVVSLFKPPGLTAYIKTILLNGQEMNGPLDLTAGLGGVLKIVLSHKVAQLNVTPRSEATGTSHAVVMVWPKSPSQAMRASGGFRSSNGSLEVGAIAPGEYYVAAWEEVEGKLLDNPDFLTLFENSATVVKLEENTRESAEVPVIPHDKILAAASKLP